MGNAKENGPSLKKLNSDIESQCAGKDLNFCKLLAMASGEDLSFTAEYTPPESYVSLANAGDEETRDSGFYYGVSPRLDSGELMRLISGLELKNGEELENYIRGNSRWFMIHSCRRQYLPALARYIVLSMACHFGVRIIMDRDQYGALSGHLKETGYSDENIGAVLSGSKIKTQGGGKEEYAVTVKGCPPEPVLEFLRRYGYKKCRYELTEKDDAVELKDPEEDGPAGKAVTLWRLAGGAVPAEKRESSADRETKSIDEVYSGHVELIRGKVFYSGVLLRPREFVIAENHGENDKITSVCVHFERSSYGTVCALDGNLTEHPLLEGDVKKTIIEMLREDDRAKQDLFKTIGEIEKTAAGDAELSADMIKKAVNAYLKSTFNVNQIGVSANIITSDGMLLLGERGSGNIDRGMLYPGANGNAEVADSGVSFYSLSVYEDYPTVRLDDSRLDFFGEISREAYGELKIFLPRQEWTCFGMTVSGNIPKPDPKREVSHYPESRRRMQFNLIFEQHTDKTFREIENSARTAAEAFETVRYFGLDITCERNRPARLIRVIRNGIVRIVNNKDFFEAAVAVILFLNMLKTPGAWLNELTFENAVIVPLSLLIVGNTLRNIGVGIYRYIQTERKTKNVRLYGGMTCEEVNGRIRRALEDPKKPGETRPIHPVAYACLRAYADSVKRGPVDRR